MQELTVSVVIPTHNRAHLIGRALRSALREAGPEDEIIVIDDGSTDGTKEFVKSVRDDRVHYIWQSRSGAGAARNRGAREATRDLVAYLDSDDEWLPGKLALQRRFMAAAPDVLFCFTDFVRELGNRRQARAIREWHTDTRSWAEIFGRPPVQYSSLTEPPCGVSDFPVYMGSIYRGEMHTNYVLTSCFVVRRREAGKAIHFTEGARTFEDWECFGHVAKCGLAGFLDFETAVQHAHPGPRLTDADLLTEAEARLVVLESVWGRDPEFLEDHGEEYRAVVHQQELLRVRGLLISGNPRAARQAMRKLAGSPVSYRVLSLLPDRLLPSVLAFRRRLLAQIRGRGHKPWNRDSNLIS